MKTKVVLIASVLGFGATPTLAETAIGEATQVARNALLDGQGARRAIERGDPVAIDNVISTDKQGRAAFRFVDDTRLSVGPNSNVKLDKFVFDGKATPSAFIIRATRGVLRFSTGRGEHEAYRIQTPAATIGVRGTQFDVKIEGADVRVSVNEGEVVLCPNRGRPNFADCVEAGAGFSILASRTRARIVPTGSLPQIRADALLPLPALAGVLPGVGNNVRQAAGAAGRAAMGATNGALGAANAAAGNAQGAAGSASNAAGGAIGAAGGAIGAAGGARDVIGGINGTLGGGVGGGLGGNLGGALGGVGGLLGR
ncbi:MAG: FecR domain-containing protein [Rhodoblastus sp.]